MKTKSNSIRRSKEVLFFLVVMACCLAAHLASAQRTVKRSKVLPNGVHVPTFLVGLEGVAGIRSFTLTSDIGQFNNVNVIEQGQSVGLVAGGHGVMVKVRHGIYNSSFSTSKEIDLKETTVSINVSPFQLGQSKQRFFEPYVLTDLDVNNVSLTGAPLPKKAMLAVLPPPMCHLNGGPPDPSGSPSGSGGPPPPNPGTHPGNPESSPDQSPSPESENSKESIGIIKAVRASAGLGVMCNIRGRQSFAKLFTEVKYGTSFKTTSTNLDLRGTKVSEQVSINFGVIMGLNTAMIGKR